MLPAGNRENLRLIACLEFKVELELHRSMCIMTTTEGNRAIIESWTSNIALCVCLLCIECVLSQGVANRNKIGRMRSQNTHTSDAPHLSHLSHDHNFWLGRSLSSVLKLEAFPPYYLLHSYLLLPSQWLRRLLKQVHSALIPHPHFPLELQCNINVESPALPFVVLNGLQSIINGEHQRGTNRFHHRLHPRQSRHLDKV
jgi:hypothetical protein